MAVRGTRSALVFLIHVMVHHARNRLEDEYSHEDITNDGMIVAVETTSGSVLGDG